MKPDFAKDGVCILSLLEDYDVEYIKTKLTSYILDCLSAPRYLCLESYHLWARDYLSKRDIALSARNRHFASEFWQSIDLIPRLYRKICGIFPQYNLQIWDEGLGTSAFRLIRPNHNDGYPPSKKSWGPGGCLLSSTIPIIGFSEYECQGFLLGSHLKQYKSYIPTSSQFCNEERRLESPDSHTLSYFPAAKGNVFIYHWDTIHTEQIRGNDVTKLSLEVRFKATST